MTGPGTRVPGWRGWLDDREWITRLAERWPEPTWVRLYWRAHWFVGSAHRSEIVCSLVGHKPLQAHKYGSYCPRCGLDPTDERW